MSTKLQALAELFRRILAQPAIRLGQRIARAAQRTQWHLAERRTQLTLLGILGACGYGLWTHPLLQSVERGEVVVRSNRLTGAVTQLNDGSLLVLPGLHRVRRFTTRDQVYRPIDSIAATGPSPFQSVEGLSLGVDLTVRYAIDPRRIGSLSRDFPADISGEIVQPIVQGVIYRLFAGYTVREIFSSKRAEIQRAIEAELKPKLAADGIVLRSVQMGKVDLPQDYRNGMDKLLAEELETEKMRYTLELKDKRVKETALDGEAEAEKVARIRSAEGSAEARRIEAAGEADSRQKLADAEVYRLERVGKVNSEQMEREGVLITNHPLLIQKTLADKLSDKIQVIIAPPPADGGFIGSTLLGSKQ